MARLSLALIAAALPLALAAPASGAGFGPSHPLGMSASGPLVAALGAHGEAAVVAIGDLGAKLAVRARIAVGDAYAASPRLVRMSNDAVVLAWRDGSYRRGSRVRITRIDGNRLAFAPRTVGRDVGQVVVSARGSGAVVGWTSAYHVRPGTKAGSLRRAAPRTLTVVPLNYTARPGTRVIIGRNVGGSVRLAGASDGRVVASWVRPQQDRLNGSLLVVAVSQQAFTRQILPRALPARPVGGSDEVAAGPPSVAFVGSEEAVTVLRAGEPRGAAFFDLLGAQATDGGPWSAPQRIAGLGFTRMEPVVVRAAAGEGAVVYTALDPTINAPPRWIVAANDATGAHRLGTTDAGDGRGATVAAARGRVLVAWTDGDGTQIAERG